MGHDAFISHSSRDKAAADAVCAALEASGVRCWVAPRDIKPGESWAAAILQGIAGCRVVVLVFSEHANTSHHIRREIERAVHRGIPIAPLRISDAMPQDDLEFFLSSSHWMDAMSPPLETHLRGFASQVRALLKLGGKTDDDHVDPQPPVRRRRAALVFALVLLAALGAAGWMWRADLRRMWAGTPSASAAPIAKLDPSAREFTNSLGMKFVRIEPGEFDMGSPAGEAGRELLFPGSETLHHVKLTHPFMMGVHHVTRGQFAAFVHATGYQTEAEKLGRATIWTGETWGEVDGASWRNPGFDQADSHPVVVVSWNDAAALCEWLGKTEQKHYRLPTEAQWEYACRGRTHTAYFWGDDPDAGEGYANASDKTVNDKHPDWQTFRWNDGFLFSSPVGSFKPNPFGLYDMIGNAWEWCSDYYGPYPAGDAVDPTGPATGDKDAPRVLRGGAWLEPPSSCRAAYRLRNAPTVRLHTIGFRVCLDF